MLPRERCLARRQYGNTEPGQERDGRDPPGDERFSIFLADPDSRSFSRFWAIIMQFAVDDGAATCRKLHELP